MFSTPRSVVRAAQGVMTVLLLMLGGLLAQGNAVVVTIAPTTIAMALFGAMGLPLLLCAFPWNRKSDLMKLLGAMIITSLVGRYAAGHADVLLIDGLAGFAGAAAGYASLGVETLRHRARAYGDVLFEVIEIEDRRRMTRRKRPTGNRAASLPVQALPAPDHERGRWGPGVAQSALR